MNLDQVIAFARFDQNYVKNYIQLLDLYVSDLPVQTEKFSYDKVIESPISRSEIGIHPFTPMYELCEFVMKYIKNKDYDFIEFHREHYITHPMFVTNDGGQPYNEKSYTVTTEHVATVIVLFPGEYTGGEFSINGKEILTCSKEYQYATIPRNARYDVNAVTSGKQTYITFGIIGIDRRTLSTDNFLDKLKLTSDIGIVLKYVYNDISELRDYDLQIKIFLEKHGYTTSIIPVMHIKNEFVEPIEEFFSYIFLYVPDPKYTNITFYNWCNPWNCLFKFNSRNNYDNMEVCCSVAIIGRKDSEK